VRCSVLQLSADCDRSEPRNVRVPFGRAEREIHPRIGGQKGFDDGVDSFMRLLLADLGLHAESQPDDSSSRRQTKLFDAGLYGARKQLLKSGGAHAPPRFVISTTFEM